jgi:AraC-like DNA-binding protein
MKVAQKAKSMLGCEVRYNQAYNGLQFSSALLNHPVSSYNAQVHTRLSNAANDIVGGLARHSFENLVSSLIKLYPGSTKTQIAEKLSISVRHMSRLLVLENTTFKKLRCTVMRNLAESWLQENITIAEIADRLGFCDEFSFSRAFKRWTGSTPTEFARKQGARSIKIL